MCECCVVRVSVACVLCVYVCKCCVCCVCVYDVCESCVCVVSVYMCVCVYVCCLLIWKVVDLMDVVVYVHVLGKCVNRSTHVQCYSGRWCMRGGKVCAEDCKQ